MRFLVDEALQEAVADLLIDSGHDATHVRRIGLAGASDDDVMDRADGELRTLVTTDTDFGRILALSGRDSPSVILLRGIDDTPAARSTAVSRAAEAAAWELGEKAIVSVSKEALRVRFLPIGQG